MLLRLIFESSSRDFDLRDLIVITAMTGDEMDDMRRLIEAFILPLLRRHQIRYVQVARKAKSLAEGIVVLDDSRSPVRVFIEGAHKLSDELAAAGTLPVYSSKYSRLCSIKFKGEVIDYWIKQNLQGEPYRHVIGFNAAETDRMERDASYTRNARSPEYPLKTRGWDRQACFDYIRLRLGVDWRKSNCLYCPFSCDLELRAARYREFPLGAARALLLEYLSLALNPKVRLYPDTSLIDFIRRDGNQAAIEAFERLLDSAAWAVYEVRRLVYLTPARPKKRTPTPAKKPKQTRAPGQHKNFRRSTKILFRGTREEVTARLARLAAESRAPVSHEGGVARAYLRRYEPGVFPSAEVMLVAMPAVPDEKRRKDFDAKWQSLVEGGPLLVRIESLKEGRAEAA